MTIKFGTDGWRGKIGDVFTDANLKTVTQATCDYIRNEKSGSNYIIVGYDNRFRSEEYAQIVAEIFASNGFEVLLSNKAVSTPVISFVTKRFNAALGICITASHNPPAYNGYKIKESFGGSALTSTIEKITPYIGASLPKLGNRKAITVIDLTTEYFETLGSLFDLTKIASHFQSIPIHLNYMHGSAAGYVGEVFRNLYVPTLEYSLNRDPLFGGMNPEPIPSNLKDFMGGVYNGLGFAFDGDGDRICAVAKPGNYVSSSQMMALLIPHMMKRSGASRAIFTVSCSQIAHKVASRNGLDVELSKIGFKYIADQMLAGPKVLIGGEESGGIGFAGYLPERDGIANCLLFLEMIANSGKPLELLLEELDEEFGPHFQDRIDLVVGNPEEAAVKIERLKEHPEDLFKNVNHLETIDGLKLYREDGSWLMLRQSGTEPVVRIYAESSNPTTTTMLLEAGRKFLS